MATPIIMPRQGQSVESCIINKWFKSVGDRVLKGDILFSYETDKASFDGEAPGDGILLDIFYKEGAEVPVLANIAVIGIAGENTLQFKPGIRGTGSEQSIQSQSKGISGAETAYAGMNTGKIETGSLSVKSQYAKVRISPRARRMAGTLGIDCMELQGSGPNGRIIVRDIEEVINGSKRLQTGNADKSTFLSGDYTDKPLTQVRKLISRAMHASLQNAAQLTHHMSADARNILEARSIIKKELEAKTIKQDISLNDIISWCVIRALVKFPEANCHFLEHGIRSFHKVNLGIAVDTSRGLMVPSVHDASDMNLTQLSQSLKSVADACRKGNVDPEIIQSIAATFTISNLGSYGVEIFTPVINLPQVAILGVCTIIQRPTDLGNSVFGFIPMLGLSLTYDHRAIDGGPATLFLKEIKEQIAGFDLTLALNS